MNFKRSLSLLFLACFISSSLWAEDGLGSDLRLNAHFPLLKNVDVSMTEYLRFVGDFSTLKWSMTLAEFEYKPITPIKLIAGYALFLQGDKENQVRNRYHLSASWKHPFNKVTLEARARFQSAYVVGRTISIDGFREMLKASLPHKHFNFYTFIEPYHNAHKSFSLTKIRFAGGLGYSLTKHHRIDGYYYYHHFIVSDLINFEHLIGMGYSYSF